MWNLFVLNPTLTSFNAFNSSKYFGTTTRSFLAMVPSDYNQRTNLFCFECGKFKTRMNPTPPVFKLFSVHCNLGNEITHLIRLLLTMQHYMTICINCPVSWNDRETWVNDLNRCTTKTIKDGRAVRYSLSCSNFDRKQLLLSDIALSGYEKWIETLTWDIFILKATSDIRCRFNIGFFACSNRYTWQSQHSFDNVIQD